MNLTFGFSFNRLKRRIRRYFKMERSISRQISAEYTEVYQRLPLKINLAYGVGHVLNDLCASMWFTYLLVFYHLVLEFDNWQTGFMLLVGQVADAVATPFVGFHSDQSDDFWLCRNGRRKGWHLLGTICILLSFPFIFMPCINCQDTSKSAQMIYYSSFIVIFQFGWAAVQISHLSLIPELTPNERDRTRLTAVRYGFTVVSNVVVYVVTWLVLHLGNGENSRIGPKDASKFQQVVWSVLSLGIVCSFLFHYIVRENSENSRNVRGGQLRTSVRDLLTDFKVYLVAVIYMSSRLFVNLTQVFVPLYLHETLRMTASSLALVPLVMFIGSFVTSLIIEKVDDLLGRKLIYILGGAIGFSACLWIKFGSENELIKSYVYIIAVLIGAGGSIVLVTSLGVTTDLIGDKTDSGAFVYGVMSFTDKMANGIAVVVIQYLHNDTGDPTYYREVLGYVCGGSVLLGAIFVSFLQNRRRNGGYERIPESSSINS